MQGFGGVKKSGLGRFFSVLRDYFHLSTMAVASAPPEVVTAHWIGFLSKSPVKVIVVAAGKFFPTFVVVRVSVQAGAVPPMAIAETSAVAFVTVGADFPNAVSAVAWSVTTGHAPAFSL